MKKDVKKKKRKLQTTEIPNKKRKHNEEFDALLSEDVKKELAISGDTNELVLPSKKKQKKEKPKPQKVLSKAELRKLKQLEEKKQRLALRKKCYKALKKTKLDEEQLKLLRSTRLIGHEETAKQKLQRAIREQRAGIPLSVDKRVIDKFWNRKDWKTDWTDEAQADMYGTQQLNEDKQPQINDENKESKPKTAEPDEDTFMVVDFGDTSANEINKVEMNNEESSLQQQNTEKADDTSIITQPAEANSNEKQVEITEKNVQTQFTDDENKDDDTSEIDEPRNWRERVCKGFSDLIDLIIKYTPENSEAQNALLLETRKLLDITIEDSDSEHESGEDYKTENQIDEKLNIDFSIQHSRGEAKYDNTKTIHELLEEADKKKPEEKKQIKYTKFFVTLDRDPEIQAQRLQLPVCSEEQPIMEAIMENDVVIICGETGSGKTTQIPQFLYEAGYANEKSGNPGMIGVTQPRRVAAVSTSKRVAKEMNLPWGENVSYHVRYDHNLHPKTQIKFMTDGILLREIQEDHLLLKYSVIILDEAHERNLNTDILIGWLSRFIPTRNKMASEGKTTPDGKKILPLKLIIMSATLRVEDFTKNTHLYKNPPPVINVSSRQYPVTVHFSKKTPFNDYVEAAFKKVVQIHEKLPGGGILVFLTGRQEIQYLVGKLKKYSADRQRKLREREAKIAQFNKERQRENSDQEKHEKETTKSQEQTNQEEEELINELGSLSDEEDDTHVLFEDNIQDEELKKKGEEQIKKLKRKEERLYVLPLYSMLNPNEQLKVFEKPPEGSRLCVVATNVAETSLTIPGIRYVVDTGRVKEREYNMRTGYSRFIVKWISKASGDQRAGRAGRTGPGHCYRLYSSAVFDQKFKQFTDPDILRIPIDNVVLQMKTMGIKNVLGFPFPTPPDKDSIKSALTTLINIGAVDKESDLVTPLGVKMSDLPVDPRYAKMLILGDQGKCLPYIISIVCAMTVTQIFITPDMISPNEGKNTQNDEEEKDPDEKSAEEKRKQEKESLRRKCVQSRKQWENPDSDLLAALRAVGAYEYISNSRNRDEFCKQNFLNAKNMREVHKLREQLVKTLNKTNAAATEGVLGEKLKPPTPEQCIMIRQIICAGFVDNVARLANLDDLNKMNIPEKLLKKKMRPYISLNHGHEMPVYIHPHSFVSGKNPEWVVYQELTKSQSGTMYMRGVTAIQPNWLAVFGKPLCKFSKPIENRYKFNQEKDRVTCLVTPSFGPLMWELPLAEVDYPANEVGILGKPRGFELQIFAKLLLEGKVIKELKEHKGKLRHQPNEMLNNINPSKDAQAFLKRLADNGSFILSKKQLLEKWKIDPSFLKEEYLAWIEPKYRKTINWPPI